jgi:hypothetical protein
MRWRSRYQGLSTRPKRPAVRRLTRDEQERLLATFAAEVQQSPVLSALGCQISAQRGRFYIDRMGSPDQERWGRITPLEEGQQYLLERERRASQWYQIAKGGPTELVGTLANDTRGTFHGLGHVEAAFRDAAADPSLLEVVEVTRGKGEGGADWCPTFFYRASARRCTAQEALHFYFGIPLNVLIHPRGWYVRHRIPQIVEHFADRSRVLVQFRSASWSGESISGSCLYLRHDEEMPAASGQACDVPAWGAYTIRPNASETIESAETWIVNRKWKPW